MAGKKRVRRYTPPKYTGVLAQPLKIEFPNSGILGPTTDEQPLECGRTLLRAQVEKIPALFAHYGLNHKKFHDVMRMVLLLAEECVPGFRVAVKKGAPRKRGTDFDLYAHIRVLQIEKRLSVQAACNALAKQWRKDQSGGLSQSAATLRRRYTAVAKRNGKLFKYAAAYDNKTEIELLKWFVNSGPGQK